MSCENVVQRDGQLLPSVRECSKGSSQDPPELAMVEMEWPQLEKLEGTPVHPNLADISTYIVITILSIDLYLLYTSPLGASVCVYKLPITNYRVCFPLC